MSAPAVGGLASVIVPCWNQLEFTRKCVAALMRQTGTNWELLVVNNGSNDGTADYLAGVQDASPVPVTVISNATNRGFPAAINQRLQYARGEYLVLLNNDVVVTDGWLDQMIGLDSLPIKEEISSWGMQKLEIRNSKSEMGTEDCGPPESHPYPGRNITLIDLAPDRDVESGLAGPPGNHLDTGSREEEIAVPNSEMAGPKSKIENPKCPRGQTEFQVFSLRSEYVMVSMEGWHGDCAFHTPAQFTI